MRRQIAFDAVDESGDILTIEADSRDGSVTFVVTRESGLALTPENARKAADFLVQVADELEPPKVQGGTIKAGSVTINGGTTPEEIAKHLTFPFAGRGYL